MQRRHLVLSAAGAAIGLRTAFAQGSAPALPEARPSPDPFHRLQGGVPHHLTSEQEAQRVVASPAPKGAPGRWRARAAMPIPRSDADPAQRDGLGDRRSGADACRRRLRRGRVDRAYHPVYDPGDDRWLLAAPLPRGANHVAVAALDQRVYALGGFIEQNRNPDTHAYVYETGADRWTSIALLPRARGAASAVFLAGKLHLIGGAGAPTQERASVGWHEVYDPQADAWSGRKPLPGARDHVGVAADRGLVHVVGGRFNTFEYNPGLHHVYLPERDTWEERAPLPTPRSGHGLVVHRGRHYAMGGEFGVGSGGRFVQSKVFGQMESYDPRTDSWQSHAPMPTPRHAVAAVAIGDWIYVAGGGAVLGGSVQSAVHEAFTLDP